MTEHAKGRRIWGTQLQLENDARETASNRGSADTSLELI
jgi:hypothetical protein